jgi:hypothetical protein
MVVIRFGVIVILFVVLALTGCVVAPGSRTSAPVTGAHSAASTSSLQVGGPVARDHASLSGPSVVGAGSFPRSFLIPGSDTSIRIGGS